MASLFKWETPPTLSVWTTRSELKRLRDYDPHLLFCPPARVTAYRRSLQYYGPYLWIKNGFGTFTRRWGAMTTVTTSTCALGEVLYPEPFLIHKTRTMLRHDSGQSTRIQNLAWANLH
ncbi:hypothetical protein Bbelb_228640 [Branchiostoma belcheri]|nr:hypothetical protein Bbelb_228640 [Branchiostoma belcheri]